mmetsp:Transcript_81003/g.224065  ORF Transcript_81003/g.224065 Transcript_81003/m.224065 type:complete len:256 (+) Transcript_81003:630-1397(+)
MRSTRRPDNAASAAPSVALPVELAGDGGLVGGALTEDVVAEGPLQLGCGPGGQDHLPPWDDAWVSTARGQQQPDGHQEDYQRGPRQCKGAVLHQTREDPIEVNVARPQDHGPNADIRRPALGGTARHESASAAEEVLRRPHAVEGHALATLDHWPQLLQVQAPIGVLLLASGRSPEALRFRPLAAAGHPKRCRATPRNAHASAKDGLRLLCLLAAAAKWRLASGHHWLQKPTTPTMRWGGAASQRLMGQHLTLRA